MGGGGGIGSMEKLECINSGVSQNNNDTLNTQLSRSPLMKFQTIGSLPVSMERNLHSKARTEFKMQSYW